MSDGVLNAEGAAPAAPAIDTALSSPAAAPSPAPASTPSPAPSPAEAAPVNQFTPSLLGEAVGSATTEEPAAPATDPGAKPEAEPKPGEQVVPENEPGANEPAPVYEFTYPESIKPEDINQERFSEFTGILGASRMPQEAAQKLVDMHIAEVQQVATRMAQAQWDAFTRQQESWKDEIRGDPELGGPRLQTAMRTAGSAIEQFGGSLEEQRALRQVLDSTGAGNNPLVVKFFHRVGESLAREGRPVAAPPPRPRNPTAQERGLSRYAGSRTPGAV